MKKSILNIFTLTFLLTGINSLGYTGNPVYQEAYWGVWSSVITPENDFLICGAEMRYQGKQGGGDDTAANGLRVVFCKPQDWKIQTTKQYTGVWGDWQGMVMCPQNYFVDGFQARIEEKQGGGDDTALNGLKFRCVHPEANVSKIIQIYGGYWGSWRGWHYATQQTIKNYDGFYFFNSFNVLFEPRQQGGDDTALNGFTFYSSNYIYALLKNMVFSSKDQKAKLGQKLKLNFDQFKNQAIKQSTEAVKKFNAGKGSITAMASPGKTAYIPRWWGYELYLNQEILSKLIEQGNVYKTLQDKINVPRGIIVGLETQIETFEALDEDRGVYVMRPLYFGTLTVIAQ